MYRVFGSTYLNPDAVGKVDVRAGVLDGTRTMVTRVFDLSGQHVLLEAETTVSSTDEALTRDPLTVKRDNEVHAEILRALRERRDAMSREEIDKELAPSGSPDAPQ